VRVRFQGREQHAAGRVSAGGRPPATGRSGWALPRRVGRVRGWPIPAQRLEKRHQMRRGRPRRQAGASEGPYVEGVSGVFCEEAFVPRFRGAALWRGAMGAEAAGLALARGAAGPVGVAGARNSRRGSVAESSSSEDTSVASGSVCEDAGAGALDDDAETGQALPLGVVGPARIAQPWGAPSALGPRARGCRTCAAGRGWGLQRLGPRSADTAHHLRRRSRCNQRQGLTSNRRCRTAPHGRGRVRRARRGSPRLAGRELGSHGDVPRGAGPVLRGAPEALGELARHRIGG